MRDIHSAASQETFRDNISFRSARPGDEEAIADTQEESFIFGYTCPEKRISFKITGHFARRSKFRARKVAHWQEVVRGKLPDGVLDQEALVALDRTGRIVGIGHAVVAQCAERGRHVELEALYLRPEAWGRGVGSALHDLLLGRLASRHEGITMAHTYVAPLGRGWDFYNRPTGQQAEAVWQDIGEVAAADNTSGFFDVYYGVPALRRMQRDLRRHPIPVLHEVHHW